MRDHRPLFWRIFHLTLALLAVFIGRESSASWSDRRPDLFIYRWHQGPPTGVSARKVSLGLSETQIQSLKNLTNGEVDFSGLYAVTATDLADALDIPGLVDQIVTGAPPPAFFASEPEEPPVVPDPELKDQWWINKLRVPEAWLLASGAGITIADCDAGFLVDETDLTANLVLEHRYSITNEADHMNVGAGLYTYHGTAVTAIMSGVLNGAGTSGIAYNSKVIPLQNFTYDTSIDKMDKEEATAQCVLRAIALPNVRIITLENQTHGSSETFAGTREAVRLALKAGITIISAAGNSNKELVEEAADDTGSIIVGAINTNDYKTVFSNHGSRVAIAGYGENLRTLFGPNGKMGIFGGTSGAVPQVAATAAMMLEVNPQLTPDIIKKIFEKTRVTEEKNAGVGGRLDTLTALLEAKNQTPDQRRYREAQALRERVRAVLDSARTDGRHPLDR